METREENIISSEYSEIMQQNYIDYAMSVIVSRALPDVRDGLKPVQRRTLYDMSELGIRHDRPYRKCARIVGDTMGKYHPHGDTSIYDALVVMAQGFKKEMPLVDGHGNFGSIEGDGAAAMRYTEARLEKVTEDAFLSDLDKNTVDFMPNFDENEKEPQVLPVRIPNFLINGSEGIAVGMATNTPPHNLVEVIEAEKAYIKNHDITTEQLMEYMPGPDFPTGGIVINKDELLSIYETGTGKIKIRGKVVVEPAKNGKKNLIITEIPYTMIGAGISKFMQDVAALVEARKTSDITDISNQSDKEGIRIVIELKRDADAENIKNLLFKKTKLEDTFGVNMLAVSNGRPETMGLRQIFAAHTAFLYEINTRKYTAMLEKERERREIQEGLIKAVDCIDTIIAILRGSKKREQAMKCLVNGDTTNITFKTKTVEKDAAALRFTEKQANAILDMRLVKLIGLEIDALNKEHDETVKKIAKYEEILSNANAMNKVIIKDLDHFQKEYGVERRTQIENAKQAVFEEKPVEEMDVMFLMDRFGYAKTIDMSAYERNKEAADAENRYCIKVKNTGRICIFTSDGDVHNVKISDVPLTRFRDKGVPIDNISNFKSLNEKYILVDAMENILKEKLLFVTANAMTKVVDGAEFDVIKKTVAATKLADDDEVIEIWPVSEEKRQIMLQTTEGFFIRFAIDEIPEKKKNAIGVRAMKLEGSDKVEAVYFMNFADEGTFNYAGKEFSLTRVKTSHRDGKGTKIR